MEACTLPRLQTCAVRNEPLTQSLAHRSETQRIHHSPTVTPCMAAVMLMVWAAVAAVMSVVAAAAVVV
jgi:hypothetical protein